MPALCSVLHVVEPALAILAGALVVGPLIALRLLRSLRWWGAGSK